MIALMIKELRQLQPIAWLWVGLLALGIGVKILGERVDEETFGSWCEGYCDPGTSPFVAAFIILFTLITAYALFPREHDESTIDFLRALPVRRSKLYLAKVGAALLLLLAVNLTSYGLDAAMLATNPESLGGRFNAQVWWTLLWRDCVFAFVILAHGVLLSWFRTVGLILYALYVILLLWLESSVGSSGLWSVFSMLENVYEGQTLLVNVTAILVHVGIAILLLFAGYRLWSRTASAASGGREVRSGGWRGSVLRGFAFTLGFIALAGVAFYQISEETGALPDESLEVVETEHYRFVYRSRDARVVEYLVEHAEADLAGVARVLGVQELPRIRVDLAAASEHAAGLATWKKIKMDLQAFEEDVSQRRVLAHEATHVLQSTVSNRALSRQFQSTQFFIEGMAQHVSFEVVPEPRRRQANHALAAIVKARQDIEFGDLIDAAAFGRDFDPELYYSLGDTWALAMVSVCGEASLGDFLRAAGREDAPRVIGGEIFWRDTFREIACELDAVNTAWSEQLARAATELDKRAFPRFENIIVERDDEAKVVRVSAQLVPDDEVDELVRPSRVVVRIRTDSAFGGAVNPVIRGSLDDEGAGLIASFAVPLSVISGSRFEYQLGYQADLAGVDDDAEPLADSVSRVLYDGWRTGSAP